MVMGLFYRKKKLSELEQLENLLHRYGDRIRFAKEQSVRDGSLEFPLYSVQCGSKDPSAPCFAVFAGVHGLERVGTHVALAFMEHLLELASWDFFTQELLKKTRIAFFPLINPVGMRKLWRANGNGVDLMRNAPVDSTEVKARFPLVEGHRYGTWLPWYRGKLGAPMETETQTVMNFIRRELFSSSRVITVDIHSGFGRVDRLWFPYAKTRAPFDHLPQMMQLKNLFDRTHPNHVYCIEPQSIQYTTHGDLWDYCYDQYFMQHEKETHFYLPLSLEIGSWIWLKKNPRQIFNPLGAFNPMLQHRTKRVLRRHLVLLEFLMRSVASHQNWLNMDSNELAAKKEEALALWWQVAS